MPGAKVLEQPTPLYSLLGGNTAIVVASDAPAAIIRAANVLKARLGSLVQICDGTADDVQIQAAIDAVSGTKWETVKLIGSFSISTALALESYLILDMTGAKLTAAANVHVMSAASTKNHIIIRGGIIDGAKGSGYTKYGIDLTGTTSETAYYVWVDGVEIQNCGDFGFSGTLATYVWLTNVKSHDNTNRGIFFNGGGHIWVTDCSTYSNGSVLGYGTYFGSNLGAGKSPHDVHVTNLNSYSNGGVGLQFSDNDDSLTPYNFEVNGGNFYSNTYGIYVQYSNNITINGVRSYSNSNDGINLMSCEAAVISGCEIHSNTGHGIIMAPSGAQDSIHIAVTGNVIHDNTGSGIVIDGTTYSTFSHNVIYGHNTSDYGINEWRNGDYNTYIGNALYDNTVNLYHTGTHDIVRDNIGYTENAGTANTGVTAYEASDGNAFTTTLTVSQADALTLADNIAKATGYKLYDFPAGAIVVERAYMSLEINAASTEIKTDQPDGGLGTALAAGAVATLDLAGAGAENVLTGQTFNDCNGTAEVKTIADQVLVIESGDSHSLYFNVADLWANDTGGDLTADIEGTVTIVWKFMA